MAEQLSYPGDAAPHIIRLLKDEQAKMRSAGAAPPPDHFPDQVPREDHLRMLLDASFFASVQKEEGRPISFRLALIPWTKASQIKREHFVFEKPIPFNSKQLVKLALAIDPNASYIGVGPAEDESLQIWGIIHVGEQLIIDQAFSSGIAALTVSVRRSGVVMVRHGGSFFSFRYALGHATLIPVAVSAWNSLNEITSPLLDFATIRGLGTYMLERGHGGAVFVIPSNVETPACVSCAKYMAASPCDILKSRKVGTDTNWGGEATARLHQGYRFVSSLTAVDGAVLMDPDCNVRAFGVFVNDPKRPTGAPLVLRNGEPYDIEQQGARHLSAVWFCDSNVKSAMALVVSQDGRASVFVRKDDTIIIEQDVDLHWHTL